MASIKDAGTNKPAEKTITFKPVEGSDFTIVLTYRPKKITLANYTPERNVDDPNALATDLCERLIVSWDLDGELRHNYTDEVLVEDNERIPLDPDIVQHVDPDVLLAINDEIHADAIPNLRAALKRSRRR